MSLGNGTSSARGDHRIIVLIPEGDQFWEMILYFVVILATNGAQRNSITSLRFFISCKRNGVAVNDGAKRRWLCMVKQGKYWNVLLVPLAILHVSIKPCMRLRSASFISKWLACSRLYHLFFPHQAANSDLREKSFSFLGSNFLC